VGSGFVGLGGVLGGLGTILERLGELAERGEELRKTGELRDAEGQLKGVYGFNVKVGLGDDGGVKIEPFGNLRRDNQTGQAVVDEVREPLVDLFDEQDHVLVVAEMPGVGENEVQLELQDDILTISAEHGDKKYRREVLLPEVFAESQMSRRCHNGILEVRFTRKPDKKQKARN
jgi:HSP20 family protein